MPNTDTQTIVITMDREFGRLEARMDALEKRHKELEERIERRLSSMDKTLTSLDEGMEEITNLLHQGKGAAKVGGWALAGVALVGGFITWLLDLWNFTRGAS